MHEAGLITIYLSQRVIDEIALVVVNKLPTAVGRLWKILQSPGLVILADSSESGPLTVNEQDRPIVGTAIDANIEYFVTGDRTLLTECRRLGLDQPQFVSPRELLDLIEASP